MIKGMFDYDNEAPQAPKHPPVTITQSDLPAEVVRVIQNDMAYTGMTWKQALIKKIIAGSRPKLRDRFTDK